MSERPEERKQAARRSRALRRVVILRSALADDGAELEALEGAPLSEAPPSQSQDSRADLLRGRLGRHERELDVRRGEYADLQGGERDLS